MSNANPMPHALTAEDRARAQMIQDEWEKAERVGRRSGITAVVVGITGIMALGVWASAIRSAPGADRSVLLPAALALLVLVVASAVPNMISKSRQDSLVSQLNPQTDIWAIGMLLDACAYILSPANRSPVYTVLTERLTSLALKVTDASAISLNDRQRRVLFALIARLGPVPDSYTAEVAYNPQSQLFFSLLHLVGVLNDRAAIPVLRTCLRRANRGETRSIQHVLDRLENTSNNAADSEELLRPDTVKITELLRATNPAGRDDSGRTSLLRPDEGANHPQDSE